MRNIFDTSRGGLWAALGLLPGTSAAFAVWSLTRTELPAAGSLQSEPSTSTQTDPCPGGLREAEMGETA